MYLLLLLGGAGIILLLCALYGMGTTLSSMTTDGTVAAFDLDAEGSIASWFSASLLMFCGLTALLVRKVQANLGGWFPVDRRGWLAVSMVWFIMSLDEGASLHEGFKEMMVRLVGTRIIGDGSVYWVVPYFFILSVTGMFLLCSFRRTPAALTCLFSAGLCHSIAVLSQMEWILRGVWPAQIMVEESAEMMGYLLILLALALHARSLVFELEHVEGVNRRSVESRPFRIGVDYAASILQNEQEAIGL